MLQHDIAYEERTFSHCATENNKSSNSRYSPTRSQGILKENRLALIVK